MPPRKPLVPFEVTVVVHYSTININNKYLGSISKHNSLLPLLPASRRIVCKFSNTNISSLTGAVDARCHLLAQLLYHCPCSHGNCHCWALHPSLMVISSAWFPKGPVLLHGSTLLDLGWKRPHLLSFTEGAVFWANLHKTYHSLRNLEEFTLCAALPAAASHPASVTKVILLTTTAWSFLFGSKPTLEKLLILEATASRKIFFPNPKLNDIILG